MVAAAVKHLSLSHFRSYKHLELEADARPQVIFGENGSGKTNILEALSLLSPGRGMRGAKTSEIARRPESVGWKIKASLDDDGSSEIETWAEPDARRSVLIDGKPTTQMALGDQLRVIWLVPVMDRLWLEGAADRRKFIDRVAMSFDPSHAEAAIGYERAMRERNRLLKDKVSDAAWYDAIENSMAEFGSRIYSGRDQTIERLHVGSSSFPQAQLVMTSDVNDKARCKNDLCYAFAAGRQIDLAAGRSLVGPHRADLSALYVEKNMAAKLCSTGEQKALLVSLILANARALTDGIRSKPVLLLDEISAHLDDARKAALYDEICNLSAQSWMTGTGLELFETLIDRARFTKVSSGGPESRICEVLP